MSIRQGEIYITRALVTACNLVKNEGEVAESVVERYVLEGLNRDHPGLMSVIEECDKAFEQTKQDNKKRLDQWRAQWPKLPEMRPVETELAKGL